MHFLLTVKTRTQVQFQYIHLKCIQKSLTGLLSLLLAIFPSWER